MLQGQARRYLTGCNGQVKATSCEHSTVSDKVAEGIEYKNKCKPHNLESWDNTYQLENLVLNQEAQWRWLSHEKFLLQFFVHLQFNNEFQQVQPLNQDVGTGPVPTSLFIVAFFVLVPITQSLFIAHLYLVTSYTCWVINVPLLESHFKATYESYHWARQCSLEKISNSYVSCSLSYPNQILCL